MLHYIEYHNEHILSYAEYGNPAGYPILIQHGLIASIQDAALFDSLLALGTRLICIARPGYGESSPYAMKNIAEWGEIVSALVAELALPEFDVLGMSSGAPYSYAIGHWFPDRTRNIFILSGTPALYDERVVSYWPYPIAKDAGIPEMQKLAYDLFFSSLTPADRETQDIQDSMRNGCYGVALDLRIRGLDWGFRLSEVKPRVILRHSRADEAVPFVTAEITAQMLPNCRLDVREGDPHFSPVVLDDFIRTLMAQYYRKG